MPNAFKQSLKLFLSWNVHWCNISFPLNCTDLDPTASSSSCECFIMHVSYSATQLFIFISKYLLHFLLLEHNMVWYLIKEQYSKLIHLKVVLLMRIFCYYFFPALTRAIWIEHRRSDSLNLGVALPYCLVTFGCLLLAILNYFKILCLGLFRQRISLHHHKKLRLQISLCQCSFRIKTQKGFPLKGHLMKS